MSRLTPLCSLEEACTGMTGLGQTDTYQAEQAPTPYEYPLPWKPVLSYSTPVAAAVGAAVGQAWLSKLPAAAAARVANIPMYRGLVAAGQAATTEAAAATKMVGRIKFLMEPVSYAPVEMTEKLRVPFEAKLAAARLKEAEALERVTYAKAVAERVRPQLLTPLERVAISAGKYVKPALRFIGGKVIPIASITADVLSIAMQQVDARRLNAVLAEIERNIPAEVAASETRMGANAAHKGAAAEQAKLALLRGYATAIARLERAQPSNFSQETSNQQKLYVLRTRYAQLERSAPWNR